MAQVIPPSKGERIVVCGRTEKATVTKVVHQIDGNVRIDLNWGKFGASYVMLHDENEVWYRYARAN